MQRIAHWTKVARWSLSISIALLTTALDAAQKPDAPKDRPPAKRKATDSGRAPTHADVKYGPAARNVLDVWLAESDKPTPLLVSIHGGGFHGGTKYVTAPLLKDCLANGISVAAITYRFSNEAIAPAQHLDAARAVQFLRSKAKEWNFDPTRVAATGGSAGAGLSLWLGFHDDLADADNPDPVLRQSTRLSGMFVYNGQSTYDPRVIRSMFPDSDTYQHPALAELYDADLTKLDELADEKYKLFEYVSALPHLTKDDPPVMLIYTRTFDAPVTDIGAGIHHPKFGVMLKEQMDKLGIPCEVDGDGQRLGGGTPTEPIVFLREIFKMPKS